MYFLCILWSITFSSRYICCFSSFGNFIFILCGNAHVTLRAECDHFTPYFACIPNIFVIYTQKLTKKSWTALFHLKLIIDRTVPLDYSYTDIQYNKQTYTRRNKYCIYKHVFNLIGSYQNTWFCSKTRKLGLNDTFFYTTVEWHLE